MEALRPELAANGRGRGAMIEAIRTLMRSKLNNAEWGTKLKGALMSAYAGRQFTQTRVMAAGWATHNRCLSCLQHIVEAEETVAEKVQDLSGRSPPRKLAYSRSTPRSSRSRGHRSVALSTACGRARCLSRVGLSMRVRKTGGGPRMVGGRDQWRWSVPLLHGHRLR